jgi:phage gpG-like protein
MKFNEKRKIVAHLKQFEKQLGLMVSEMGVIANNHYVKSFSNQGFTDSSLQTWQPRKRTLRRDRNKPNRAILVNTGHLRRSIARKPAGRLAVKVYTPLVYAAIHNEGLNGKAWGKHPFKMPKRKFMGYSKVMDEKIQKMIDRRIKLAFK